MTRSLIASTLRKHEKEIADNITRDILILKLLGDKDLAPKLFRFRKPEANARFAEGLKMEDDPGRKIVPKIRKGRNTTVRAYSGFDTLSVDPQDNFDEVEFDWKSVSGSVHLAQEDLDKNRGSKTKIFDLLDASVDDLKLSLQEEVGMYLLGQTPNTVQGKKQPGGILDLIQDDPTTLPVAGSAVIGGIDASLAENSFWRNQAQNHAAAAFGSEASPATGDGFDGLTTLHYNCTYGMEKPEVYLAGQIAYRRLGQGLSPLKRYVDQKTQVLIKAGIDAISFMSTPVVREAQIDTVRTAASLDGSAIYALNMNFYRVHGMAFRWFKMTDFRNPTNQDSRVAHCIARLNAVTRGRRYLGVMFNIV